ncbi:hypothetical protein SAMN05443144_1112 [Fodinibius roseus]|uniref:Uncharacterized protein n=1 Tax=Fodinibius roseus TaxID=1194090 RepID=A0A1M5D538_9BACT|nr:hypothetical protein SAMN05443144_1112 [Fodinibius roseus]
MLHKDRHCIKSGLHSDQFQTNYLIQTNQYLNIKYLVLPFISCFYLILFLSAHVVVEFDPEIAHTIVFQFH